MPTIKHNVTINEPVNIYGDCFIDSWTSIGAFTEIGPGVKIGKFCRIQAHVFIPEGVEIRDNVFIGPGVRFTNVKHVDPLAVNDFEETLVEGRVVIGANATILPGIVIGEGAVIGAGAVVTKDVPEYTTVVGNPARPTTPRDYNSEPTWVRCVPRLETGTYVGTLRVPRLETGGK